jgi:hypothetical protein
VIAAASPLPPGAPQALAFLLVLLWLRLRIGILRRREARRAPGEAPPPAWVWLRALAGRPETDAVLLVLAALGLAVLAWTFLRP